MNALLSPAAGLLRPRPETDVVAFGDGPPLRHAVFRRQVSGLAQSLRGCGAATLACRDSAAFAIGLVALLRAGARVLLPPNGLSATLAALPGGPGRLVDDAAVWAATPSEQPPPAPPADAAVVFFTSGSSGAPKSICRPLAELDREAATLEDLWGGRLGAAPVLALVGHQHLYGLTFKILWPLAAGRPFDRRTHEVWESLLADLPERAALVVSPAHLGRMGGLAPLPAAHRPAAVFTAGAPLAAAAARQAAALLGAPPIEIFGSTETGAVATRRQILGDEDWTLLPGHRLLESGDGRLRLYSPYHQAEVETADRVLPRPGGFRFLGRADRIAKVAGKRVALAEVEQALTALPWLAEAAALQLDDGALAAVAVPSPAGAERLAALGPFRFSRLLRRDLAERLDAAALPKRWRFPDALPFHPLGKSIGAALAALFTEETAR
ncbi:phenyloxazoline synthase MbtB [mine drainage metagenome]|uniref:Phenyloxazoline synthase MbtB n=1 Tax=mine drainage metagenome TaxID=410659 RepID=A0A1J5T1I0_9ZZZZ